MYSNFGYTCQCVYMKFFFICLFSLFQISALISYGDEHGDFKPMFNGKDLSGWKTSGNWVVDEGNVVTLKPRDGESGWKRYGDYLRTLKKYGDFVLDLEFKINKGGNSGVFMRVGDEKDHVESGFEVQILDTYGKKDVGHHDGGGIIRTSGPSKNMMKPAGEWNRYTITLVGSRIKVVLNGEEIQDVDLSRTEMRGRPLSGYISFQDEAKRVWYRNVRIKELPVMGKVEEKVEFDSLAEKYRVPENFKVREFAGNSLINNPLALTIGAKNEVYLAEVWRFQRGVEDTRQHNYWMEDEVRIMNMGDKLAMFEKWTKAGKFKPGHFSEYSDRVVRLHDKDGDGVADKVSEYASGFNDPQDGIGSSILTGGDGSLYYTNIPHVWKLKDADGDGVAEKREKIVSGFGLRMGVSGHDLHGLVWGNDGRLYFSNGDRGYDIVSKDGKKFYSAEEGAVFRCEPDGSGLEIFTRGNRNPQDLEFDEFGNLYTVDNNRGYGDRSRLCYLVEGGQYGWNSGYENIVQFRWALKLNKRMGPRYDDPWVHEGAWRPKFTGQPDFCIPSVAHIDGGSAGLLFNSGLGLGDKYKDSFIFAACTQGVYSFRVKRDGAGVSASRIHRIWEGGYLVDAELSHDSALYIVDYVTTQNTPKGENKGAVFSVVDEKARKKASVVEAAEVLSGDVRGYGMDVLVRLLGHVDRRVRLKVQFELVRRGGVRVLAGVAEDRSASLMARLHAVWGLGQLSRRDVKVNEVLRKMLSDGREEVVSQAVKVIGESYDAESYDALLKLVDHRSRRVISFLAPALAKCGGRKSLSVLGMLADRYGLGDAFLRNAVVTGMDYAGDADGLLAVAGEGSEGLRLCSLLALLRMEDARCVVFLSDASERIQHAAVRGIYRHNIGGAVKALAEYAKVYVEGATGVSESVIARSIQSNFRLGDMASAKRIMAMALNKELSMKVRLICLYELTRWNERHDLVPVDPVAGQVRGISDKRVSTRAMVLSVLDEMGKESHKDLDYHLVTLGAAYGLEVDNSRLAVLALNVRTPVADRVKYFESISDKAIRDRVREKFLDDRERLIVKSGLSDLLSSDLDRGLKYGRGRIEGGKNLQGVYAALGDLKDEGSLGLILLGAESLLRGKHEQVSALDLVSALEMRSEKEAKDVLLKYERSFPADDTLRLYRHTMVGGNVSVGKQLVKAGKGQCKVCHSFWPAGSKKVGPNLASIGKQERSTNEYLLRSLIEPSDYVVKGYGDAKVSAMPSMKKLLTKSEMRDIIAYLKTLKKR